MEASQRDTIQQNIEGVLERIHDTAINSGRNPGDICLVAVTKQKPAIVVKTLAELGIKRVAESYLKEAFFKIDLLKELDIEWHMIGSIQKGKEKDIASRFYEVHSVESVKMAKNLDRYAKMNERVLPVYLEFNVSGEDTKHGWKAWSEKEWPVLIADLGEILDLPNIWVKGLMTMAPYSSNPEKARPYFIHLRKLRNFLAEEFTHAHLDGLSMGMSGDFEVAIEEGATVLRIGSALVGPR